MFSNSLPIVELLKICLVIMLILAIYSFIYVTHPFSSSFNMKSKHTPLLVLDSFWCVLV